MYHDLWYFHPFPSKLTEEDQVLPWWYKNWIKMSGKKIWSISGIIVSLKFIGMSLLRWSLIRVVDVHLMPSEFMVKYLIEWGVKKSSIKVLPHFIG
jgi:hypothetical protein